jgi:hypothetical protein
MSGILTLTHDRIPVRYQNRLSVSWLRTLFNSIHFSKYI